MTITIVKLKRFLTKPWIQGINLDVEEVVNIEELKYFIKQLIRILGKIF